MLEKWNSAVYKKRNFGALPTETLFGVPQGSILVSLLFNIFLSDLFFIMNDVDFPSYADDNTSFFVGDDLNDVILKFQNASKTLFK